MKGKELIDEESCYLGSPDLSAFQIQPSIIKNKMSKRNRERLKKNKEFRGYKQVRKQHNNIDNHYQ